MNLPAYLVAWLRRRGFVPADELVAARKATTEALTNLANEKTRHRVTVRELGDARAFITERLQSLTMIEPVMRWPSEPRPIYGNQATESFPVAHARAMEIVEGRRRDVIIRVICPAVFEYWDLRNDIRYIDEAIRYVAAAAAHQIEKTLRFGLIGERK